MVEEGKSRKMQSTAADGSSVYISTFSKQNKLCNEKQMCKEASGILMREEVPLASEFFSTNRNSFRRV